MIPAVSTRVQLQLDFEPSLIEQFRTFREVLAAAVYGSRLGLSGVAGHCDLSPSALTRMLNSQPGRRNDPRHLRADLVPLIIEATQDFRPIYWLAAKFVPDDGMRQRAAVTAIESLLPQITQALTTLQRPRK